jgi:hypothetical protein
VVKPAAAAAYEEDKAMDVRIEVVSAKLQAKDRDDRRNARPRVYVWAKDENVLDNLANRRNRPVALYREAAGKALSLAGVTYTKLRWSQQAGCPCGCSPGFVLHGAYSSEWGSRFDMHVTARIFDADAVSLAAADLRQVGDKDRLLAIAGDLTMPEGFRDEALDKAFEQLQLAL